MFIPTTIVSLMLSNVLMNHGLDGTNKDYSVNDHKNMLTFGTLYKAIMTDVAGIAGTVSLRFNI